MEVFVQKGGAYSQDYVEKMTRAHLNPKFVPPIPMQRERVGRPVSAEDAERFRNRPGRVPWPWEKSVTAVTNSDKEYEHGS